MTQDSDLNPLGRYEAAVMIDAHEEMISEFSSLYQRACDSGLENEGLLALRGVRDCARQQEALRIEAGIPDASSFELFDLGEYFASKKSSIAEKETGAE